MNYVRTAIIRIRTNKGLSVKDVATRCNVSQSHLHAIERGGVVVRVDTLLEIAGALGVPSWTLLPDGDRAEIDALRATIRRLERDNAALRENNVALRKQLQSVA